VSSFVLRSVDREPFDNRANELYSRIATNRTGQKSESFGQSELSAKRTDEKTDWVDANSMLAGRAQNRDLTESPVPCTV
jgi:hypothetical protein